MKFDLTNSTVATCKSYDPDLKPPKPKEFKKATLDDIGPTLGDEGPKKPKPILKPFIWDPMVKTSFVLKDHNHQVTIVADGPEVKANPNNDMGPRGDFVIDGLPLANNF